MLEKEYSYFNKNKASLLKKYNNKFIVIMGEEVIGAYDTQEEALRESSKKYAVGTFLIQKVSNDPSDTVQKFFSNVYF